jgi:uncharacterized protein YjiS (DUF1127 family)
MSRIKSNLPVIIYLPLHFSRSRFSIPHYRNLNKATMCVAKDYTYPCCNRPSRSERRACAQGFAKNQFCPIQTLSETERKCKECHPLAHWWQARQARRALRKSNEKRLADIRAAELRRSEARLRAEAERLAADAQKIAAEKTAAARKRAADARRVAAEKRAAAACKDSGVKSASVTNPTSSSPSAKSKGAKKTTGLKRASDSPATPSPRDKKQKTHLDQSVGKDTGAVGDTTMEGEAERAEGKNGASTGTRASGERKSAVEKRATATTGSKSALAADATASPSPNPEGPEKSASIKRTSEADTTLPPSLKRHKAMHVQVTGEHPAQTIAAMLEGARRSVGDTAQLPIRSHCPTEQDHLDGKQKEMVSQREGDRKDEAFGREDWRGKDGDADEEAALKGRAGSN